MSGPWEKYAAAGQKPWEKYAAVAPSLSDSIPVPGAETSNAAPPASDFGSELARTVSPVTDPLIGAGELGLSGVTNLGGKVVGGLAGLVQGAGDTLLTNPYNYLTGKPLVNPMDTAADRSRSIEEALTYQPGERGQDLGAGIALGAKNLYGKTGLPTLTPDTPFGQTFAPAAGDALASLTALPKVGSGVLRAADAATIAKPKPFVEPIPTSAELRAATTAAYKRANESGALVTADKFAKAADEIAATAKSEAVDPVLHPKTSRLVDILQERKGKDLTLEEAENLRRIGLEAENDVNQIGKQTADGMRAGKIVDALDEKIDALAANDEARALNRRKMNSQTIDLMIERATNNAGAHYTQAGMEHSLRQQFKQLANNPARMNRFSAEQRAAIQKVVRGGPMENFLRGIGKFDPTAGAVPFIAGTASGGTMMLPGFLARRAATRMTANNVEAARAALVGRGLPSEVASTSKPTMPVSVAQALLAQPRSIPAIQADIQTLVARAGRSQAAGQPASASARAIWAELARLQTELKSAEARQAAPPAPVGPQSQ